MINFYPGQPPGQPVYLKIEARKSLSATAYRLRYVTHVIEGEMAEIESAITEEDKGHYNITLMAAMLQELSKAQEQINAVIEKLHDKDPPSQSV